MYFKCDCIVEDTKHGANIEHLISLSEKYSVQIFIDEKFMVKSRDCNCYILQLVVESSSVNQFNNWLTSVKDYINIERYNLVNNPQVEKLFKLEISSLLYELINDVDKAAVYNNAILTNHALWFVGLWKVRLLLDSDIMQIISILTKNNKMKIFYETPFQTAVSPSTGYFIRFFLEIHEVSKFEEIAENLKGIINIEHWSWINESSFQSIFSKSTHLTEITNNSIDNFMQTINICLLK